MSSIAHMIEDLLQMHKLDNSEEITHAELKRLTPNQKRLLQQDLDALERDEEERKQSKAGSEDVRESDIPYG